MRKIISIILMGVILLSSITVIAYENERNEEFEEILDKLAELEGTANLASSGAQLHSVYQDGEEVVETIIEYKITDEDKKTIISLLENIITNDYLNNESEKNLTRLSRTLLFMEISLSILNIKESGGYEEVIAKVEEVQALLPSKEEKSDTKKIVGGKTKTHYAFTDVKTSDWFYNDVDDAYRAGLIKGVEATLFNPYGTLTIAEAIALAARINVFEDDGEGYINIDSWCAGVEELETFMFDSKWHWAEGYMNYATKHNIIQKKYTLEELDAPITRAEMADLFSRTLHVLSEEYINDFSKAPEQNVSDSVKKLYELGVVVGDDTGSFRLEDCITRAETAAIICRMRFPYKRIIK